MATKLNESKRALIGKLIEEYNIKNGKDIQEALKELLGGTIQEMLETELDEELGYEKSERTEAVKENYRNGYKLKSVKTGMAGEIELAIPQERNGEFEPKIVPKYSRDISGIEQKIINMYGRGLTTREISEQIDDIYGFEASAELISKVTDRIIPQIEEWQNRTLSEIYPIIFIDAIIFNVRKERIVSKKAVYVVLGINSEGMKEVLSIEMGDVESSKYWLGVLNNLRNRGVRDIMIICADGLSGIKEAIETAYPMAEYQHCIVHMVRNTLKHVSDKDRKEFAGDLKSIYHAPNEEAGLANMLEVTEKWNKRYPNAMARWNDRWGEICPIFKYSTDVRKAFYTTNAIESLNSQYRRINKSRSVFPSEDALKKAMYLSTMNITKKWVVKIHNWGRIYGELSIHFGDRLTNPKAVSQKNA